MNWTYNSQSKIDSLKVSGDGSTLIAGLDNGTAILLNSNGHLTFTLQAPASSSASGGRVTNVGIAFNGSTIVANKEVYTRGMAQGTLEVGAGGYTIAPSQNGSDFVTSSDDSVLYGSLILKSPAYKNAGFTHGVEEVRALLTPDASQIFVESQDTMLSTINLQRPAPLGLNYTVSQSIVAFDTSFDGSFLVLTTTSGEALFISHGIIRNFTQPGLAIPINSDLWQQFILYGVVPQNVAVPWNGNFVAITETDGFLGIYNQDGGVISRESVSSGPIQSVAVSADGGTIALASGTNVSLYTTHGLQEPVSWPPVKPTCSFTCVNIYDVIYLLIGLVLGGLIIGLVLRKKSPPVVQ